ncbi:MAG: hypothetical protein U9N81_13490 [Bacillota bacterium]|nr:hypothetical protein [Bacillota bacterium]
MLLPQTKHLLPAIPLKKIAIGLESSRRGQENAVSAIYNNYSKKILSTNSITEAEKVRGIAHGAINLNKKFGKATKFASKAAIPLALFSSVAEIISAKDKISAIIKELGSTLGAIGGGALTGAVTGALVGGGVLSPATALIGTAIGAGVGAFGGQAVANKLYDRFAFHADGGILTKPHMGLVVEDGAEGIIPLSPSKRSRGIDLWQRTRELLGVQPYEDGVIVRDMSVAAPQGTASRSNEGINFTVNNKIEPSFTFEIRAGADPDEIVAVIKSRTQEFTDDIGDNLAERLALCRYQSLHSAP